MSVLRGAALGAACILAFASADAGAILDVGVPEARVQTGVVTTVGSEGPSQWAGFCALVASTDPTGTIPAPRFTGVAFGAVADNAPSGVDLECEVHVNNAAVPATFAVAAEAAFASTVSYNADDADTVEICIIVTISVRHIACSTVTEQGVPPSELLVLVNDVLRVVDPILCPVLGTLDPVVNLPGLLDIDAQGDVYLLGDRLYDCPPYDF